MSPQTLSHDSSLQSQGASCSSDDRLSSRSSSGRPLDDNDTGICNVDVDVGHLDTVTPTPVSSSSSSSASAGGPVVALSSCLNAATAILQSGGLTTVSSNNLVFTEHGCGVEDSDDDAES